MSPISTKSPKKSHANSSQKKTARPKKRRKKSPTTLYKIRKHTRMTKASRAAQRTPIGTPAFRALRNEWYAKLKKAGFKDAEHVPANQDTATSYMQNGSLTNIAKRYKPETLHYYRRWSAYLSHNKRAVKDKQELEVLLLYTEGVPYRDISKQLKPRYKTRTSIHAIHHIIKRWLAVIIRWNKVSQYGLDFEVDIG